MEEDPCLSRERDTSDPPAQQGSGGQGRRNPYRTGLQLFLPGGHVSAAVPGVDDCLGEGGRGSGSGQSYSGRIQPCGKAWPGLGSPRSDVKRGRPRPPPSFYQLYWYRLPFAPLTHTDGAGGDCQGRGPPKSHWLPPASFSLFAPRVCPPFSPPCVTPVDPRDPQEPGASSAGK